MTTSVRHSRSPETEPLPQWLDRCTDYALRTVIAASVLYLFAFFTNPVPDPSFPWATLPPSIRLPIMQPRIEHWPITYTVGIWLFVVSFPFLFFAGYRRFGVRNGDLPNLWFTALPVVTMFGFTSYCRFFWPKLHLASWNAPSHTLVCWGYCSTYVPHWSNAAFVVVGIGFVATSLAYRGASTSKHALAVFGILAFPLGIPALYEIYR